MGKKKYYITTPIYYPSGKWHLGHCYTTVCCDAIARFKRMKGFDVFFLTGTDEHGQKIEKKAADAKCTPKQFVDNLVADIQKLWGLLDVSYDKFIRTTDTYHEEAVQKIFTRLYEQGDIYKGKYSGKYCTPCESFWTESQLVDGKCPDCGREVVDAEEECYFFRLSKYQDRIKELLTTTDFLQPQTRVNEMVNNFLKEGLSDLAVSRTSFTWGVPVPFDKKHVVYVWIDALSNYITALGYAGEEENMKYWPADLHMVGKEIVRFHTIIWPAILMALGLPLPQKVYGHGWLLLDGDKMSKSKGNVVDPYILAQRYSVDAIRYYLLREIPFGSDGTYTNEQFITRINQDLVNDLGNLSKRTLAMSKQYFDGKVSKPALLTPEDNDFVSAINGLESGMEAKLDELNINKALECIFAVIDKSNKYIDLNKPWELNKNGDKERLEAVIYNLLEALRVCSTALLPFLTQTPQKIFASLGVTVPDNFDGMAYGKTEAYATEEIEVLFPRIDKGKELKELEELARKLAQEEKKPVEEVKTETVEDITIDEFFKAKLVVGEVLACEKVEKADRLLKSTVKMGDEVRTIVSGIAKFYTPEQMVGKKVVVVANLAPRKIRGIESKGMILCACSGEHGSEDEKLCVVSPEDVGCISGSEVC